MKKRVISVALIGVIAAAGVLVSLLVRPAGADAPQSGLDNESRRPNIAIQVLAAGDVDDLLVLTGTVEPWEEVTLSAETSGRIEWLGVEEGDAVAPEQELVRVNTTSVRARLNQAKAEHTLAKQEFERVQALQKGGISSPSDYDKAVTNRDATAAAVRLHEIEVEQSVVRAGIPGVVDLLYKEQGEYVTPGVELARIVQVDRVKVVVGLPERDVPHVQSGDAARITLDAYPDREFEGTVFRIATTAEAETRTFPVEIELKNSDGLMKPGMIARTRFVRRTFRDAITVPLFAVLQRDNERLVFIEQDGIVHRRPVEIGFYQEEFVHVTDGLHPGDRLVVLGQRNLKDGEAVDVQRVVDPQ